MPQPEGMPPKFVVVRRLEKLGKIKDFRLRQAFFKREHGLTTDDAFWKAVEYFPSAKEPLPPPEPPMETVEAMKATITRKAKDQGLVP